MLFEAIASLFLGWFLLCIFQTYEKRRRMPPGPLPLPFIGNLHQIGFNQFESFGKLQKIYGDIFTISVPIGTVVVLNSWDTAYEAFVTRKDDIMGRVPRSIFPFCLIFEEADIISADYGPAHQFRRKVFRSALHVFGTAGVRQASERVSYVVQSLLEQVDSTKGRPFSPRKFIGKATTTELWYWLTSNKCSFGDPIVESLIELNRKSATLSIPGSLYNLFPLLRFLPTSFRKHLREVLHLKEAIYASEFQSHRELYKPGIDRDLTDSFLTAYMETMAKESEGSRDFGAIEDIKGLMLDVIFAGADTSSSFISWFLLYMLFHQDVQEKIHNELDNVVETDQLPSWDEADKLHYLQATMCEVMRLSSIVPILNHTAIRDTTIKSFKIPKGTIVYVISKSIHSDPKYWPEPEEFKPERFLDADGMFVGWSKTPGFLPFGIGRRYCAGEALAKIQIVSIVSGLMHRFKFQLDQDEPMPTLDPEESAVIIFPKEYNVVACKRV